MGIFKQQRLDLRVRSMGWKLCFIPFFFFLAGVGHIVGALSPFMYMSTLPSLSPAKGMIHFHSSLQVPGAGRFLVSSGFLLCPCVLGLFQGREERAATGNRCDSWLRVVALHDLNCAPSITRHRRWVFLDRLRLGEEDRC